LSLQGGPSKRCSSLCKQIPALSRSPTPVNGNALCFFMVARANFQCNGWGFSVPQLAA